MDLPLRAGLQVHWGGDKPVSVDLSLGVGRPETPTELAVGALEKLGEHVVDEATAPEQHEVKDAFVEKFNESLGLGGDEQ